MRTDNTTVQTPGKSQDLLAGFQKVRAVTEQLCTPLTTDDHQIQSITETSPPKWHLAHVSWFFETFVLEPHVVDYHPFDPRFRYLFNSYYETVGNMHPRARRGLLSRPTLQEVLTYRSHVDRHVKALLQRLDTLEAGVRDGICFRIELGIQHEQQHQELLLMDIKHNFHVNPLQPAYRSDLQTRASRSRSMGWIERPGGIREIGASDDSFHFDNETPRHPVLLHDHRLADRLVTNAEYLAFVQDGGYDDPRLWLADGWQHIRQNAWRHPLYWEQHEGEWREFTLRGTQPLDPDQPVAHLSYYEADAFARWTGKRLPSEAEMESALEEMPVRGNFVENDCLHPQSAAEAGQWYGDLWCWTASPYSAYPGFRPLQGSIGEYNGKFMANQMVLKGGSCVTPAQHVRASYRNFFYPHDRWPFTGLRLTEDA